MPVLGESDGTFPHAEDWLRAWGIHLRQHPYINRSELQRYFMKRLQQFGLKVNPRPATPAYTSAWLHFLRRNAQLVLRSITQLQTLF